LCSYRGFTPVVSAPVSAPALVSAPTSPFISSSLLFLPLSLSLPLPQALADLLSSIFSHRYCRSIKKGFLSLSLHLCLCTCLCFCLCPCLSLPWFLSLVLPLSGIYHRDTLHRFPVTTLQNCLSSLFVFVPMLFAFVLHCLCLSLCCLCVCVCAVPLFPLEIVLEILTNLQSKGLISADRGTKATLVLTIPRSLYKSFTEDLSLPIFEFVFQHRLRPH
jgi:hypothetical protein